MIIAFTHKTSKRLARILCRRFRHCCVIFDAGRQKILVQIGIDGVRLIPVDAAAMRRMRQTGWVMVKVRNKEKGIRNKTGLCRRKQLFPTALTKTYSLFLIPFSFLTCVGFAKRAMGTKNPFIWTPDGLYRELVNRNQ